MSRRGRCVTAVVARALGRRRARLRARVHVKHGDAREAVELLLDVDEARLDLVRRVGVVLAARVAELVLAGNPNKCLPRHPANTFVLLWELHLQGETPARSWLFRDPVLRRIEEATRSRTRAQRAAKLREIEEAERRALAPPPREPGSDEEDDREDESD